MGGVFLVLDGPDGSGKTTQTAHLANYLRARGETVRVLREPGATPAGEAIRDLLLDPDTDVVPVAEMLLYQAARAQVVAAVIRPELAQGHWVVLDRYCFSTMAYQGYGLGLDPAAVRSVTEIATGGLMPDHLFLLDLDPALGLERSAGGRRGADRIEGRPLEYHRRVREGFLAEAKRFHPRASVLDAGRAVEIVAEAIRQRVEERWPPRAS